MTGAMATGERMRASENALPAERMEYILRLADTSLILAQQLGAWVGHAPALEEDLGTANVALDLLGQARLLLTYVAEIEGRGRSEDDLAFLREPADFRNVALVEQPNGDFAHTIVRQFLIDAWQQELFGAMQRSTDPRLAGIAAKALKETLYHVRYSGGWLVRLGDGTAESHRRVADALETLWPFTAELFAPDALDEHMAALGIAPRLTTIEPRWRAAVGAALAQATLSMPQPASRRWFGKRGQHGEALGRLLAEMQYLQRTYPGAQW